MYGTQVKVTTELMIGLSPQQEYGPLFIRRVGEVKGRYLERPT